MEPIEVSYLALKAVFNTGTFTIYYALAGDEIIAAVIAPPETGKRNLRCLVGGEDLEDFDVTIRPSAIQVNDVDDAYGLIPLGVVPPAVA